MFILGQGTSVGRVVKKNEKHLPVSQSKLD